MPSSLMRQPDSPAMLRSHDLIQQLMECCLLLGEMKSYSQRPQIVAAQRRNADFHQILLSCQHHAVGRQAFAPGSKPFDISPAIGVVVRKRAHRADGYTKRLDRAFERIGITNAAEGKCAATAKFIRRQFTAVDIAPS